MLPIRARMTAWFALLLAMIIGAVGTFLVVSLRADLTAAIDRTLRPATAQIAAGYGEEGPPEARDTSATVLSGQRVASQIVDGSGRVTGSFGDRVGRAPMLDRTSVREALRGRRILRTASLGADRDRFRVAAQAAQYRGRRAVVVAAESMATVDRSVDRVIVLLLIAGPAALLATAAGGWWLAARALRPIERVRAEAEQIGVERLADRLAVPATRDEVARLAVTLNSMLARIEHGVQEQRRLIADASHELRTPLAAMRAELDVSLRADELGGAARAALASTREEVDRMSRTVDDLLTLASADEGRLELLRRPADVAEVAEQVVRSLRPLARSRGIDLRVEASPVLASIDRERMRHAIGNLVHNAIEHGPAPGTVVVRARRAGADAMVSVEDDGAPVSADMRERVFDRFVRRDASRARTTGGAGIGLSIVREIARAHRGRAWTEPAGETGNRFAISLPALARDDADDTNVRDAPAIDATPARPG